MVRRRGVVGEEEGGGAATSFVAVLGGELAVPCTHNPLQWG